MASATLLLPAQSRLSGQGLPADIGKVLARADIDQREAGEQAQLRRHFSVPASHWPVAALTRQQDAGDAAGASWLRADPARIVPDMSGARMMAYGASLELDADDANQLLPALRPLFGDAGLILDAPHPARWYLRLPAGSPVPVFAPIDQVLGDDLFEHLPEGAQGARWRALLTEAQIVLHNHPHNARRLEAGKQPINSLWFWGGGVLPEQVTTTYRQVRSNDVLLQALAAAAGLDRGNDPVQQLQSLVDVRQLRQLQVLCDDALRPLLQALHKGELQQLDLDFEDGVLLQLRAAQRWRFWRKPLSRLDLAPAAPTRA
ncbi:hypothetical protein [Pseudoxanthomonas dokdonensis]|uniref:Phosphoglycerate mutase n=1 Tax=Pseudoxanthomonas dokdonensis TaxID=344882 RepID=A0A0R0CYG6_9GAMM|nr:hypothetical protein [Pseudoxanthomonas dokdonensis]KRG71182.1 phosphoglycerate mutase [Pseudoxanthomonas dokdonensis]